MSTGSYSTIKKRMHILFQKKTSLKEEKVVVAEDDPGYVVTWETPLGLLRRPIGDLI